AAADCTDSALPTGCQPPAQLGQVDSQKMKDCLAQYTAVRTACTTAIAGAKTEDRAPLEATMQRLKGEVAQTLTVVTALDTAEKNKLKQIENAPPVPPTNAGGTGTQPTANDWIATATKGANIATTAVEEGVWRDLSGQYSSLHNEIDTDVKKLPPTTPSP